MNIIITTRKKHPVEDEKLYELFLQSYQKWHNCGIDAAFLHYSFEKFQRITGKDPIFIALDADSDELLGMVCFRLYKKKRYVFDYFLAVSPMVRHQGIATRMLRYACDILRAHGYKYIKDVTATNASWSVRWHLKNGYRIVGFGIGCKPYGDTYSFRLQLAPSLLWDGPLAPITAKCSYFVSRTAAYLTHRSSDGSLNWIGRMARRIMRKKLRVPNLHRYVYSELIK